MESEGLMSRRRFFSFLQASFVLFLFLITIGCGAGLNRGGGGETEPVTVSVSPTTATLTAGKTQQFDASVSGSSNTTVQWQVNNITGGNSDVGTVSSAGLYTAPQTDSSMSVTVTAIAMADTSKSASAAVTVNPGNTTGISVTISPTSAMIAVGKTQQFSAHVDGSTNTQVTWSVDGVDGGNSTVGTVTDAGLYAAPPTAGSHTVTATSVADTTQAASASVSVVSLTVSPETANIATSATEQFTATVTGTSNTAVTWSVDGVKGGNSTLGTISSDGLYTAPSTDGTHTVTAISVALPSLNANATVVVGTGHSGDITAIKHIIFISQENRSFDTYFGKLNEYRAKNGLPTDVDGLPDDCRSSNSDWTVPCGAMNKSPDANGIPTTPIYAFRLKTMCIENTSADWIVSHWSFNAEDPSSDTPLMDGFVIGAASSALANGFKDTKGIRAMGFYNGDDLEHPYWLATQFATSDRFFAPGPTKTEPNRYFMVGATTGGHAYPLKTGTINQKTIFDLLEEKGVSWKIYSEDGFTSASAFSGFMSRFADRIVPFSQFITDAQSGTLPEVAYVEKPDADQHPGSNVNLQYGVRQVRDLVNAVMYDANGGPGPSWKDSVIIITFDESGGLYDHVPPPTNVPNPDGIKPLDICTNDNDPNCPIAFLSHQVPPYDPAGDFTRYGFRVPLMVVSPFTKPHYVSHTPTDFTSWMKLVEKRFNLPSLNARDAKASDMTEYFDFEKAPWATPPANPPTVNLGQCYDTLP
jgi:phospholipase C